MMKADQIDVHQPVVPPFWVGELPSHGGDASGWRSPAWTPEATIQFMDEQEIAIGVLSLTAPSVVGWAAQERRAIHGELTNTRRSSSQGRQRASATSPPSHWLMSRVAVIKEQHSLDVLHADGVMLLTNYDGVYLGDPKFAPLWEALDQRSAVVFVHPGHPELKSLEGLPGPVIDYPFNTTRSAVHMVMNGVLERYAGVKIILSHAGASSHTRPTGSPNCSPP